MNDFTKEELIYLHNHIDFQLLKNKIQSMIDNYPEIYHLPKDAKIGDKITIPASDKGWIIK